jgi:hypothetical protein
MSAHGPELDIHPMVDIPPMESVTAFRMLEDREAALAMLLDSSAVQKVRISSRGGSRLIVNQTGEEYASKGPALWLRVDETLFKGGW